MGIHMKNSVNYTGGGMGVGATKLELTLDEYEALTPEEKNNGTMYFLTDVNGDGEQFQPIIYSEDEREIGVWTDGKPLYQKTYIVHNITTDTEIDLNIPNIEIVVNQWGTWDRTMTNGIWTYDLNAVNELALQTNFIVLCRARLDTNKLYIGYSSTTAYSTIPTVRCTLQYTKTTDTPGSGTWTPQGIPAVHYDDTEKVVGTWFGETLYEKSYYVQGVKDSAITVDSSITGTTVKLIEVKQTFFTTGGVYANIWGNNSISYSMFLRTLLGNAGLGVNFDGYRTDYYGNDGFDVYLTIRYTKISSS